MKDVRKRKGWFLLLAALLCGILLTGCGRKYEAAEAPAVEEAKSGLAENETLLTIKNETVQTSSHEAVVTTQTAPAFIERDETIYVIGSQVNVRNAPSIKGEIMGKLNKGDSLKRTGYNDTWSRVVYQGKECFISSQYVSKDKPKEEIKSTQPSSGSTDGSGKIIAIDPGHQAKGNPEKEPMGPGASKMKAKVSSGATGVATGIPEYKLNLAVSLKLKKELINRGYQVVMTRETNDVNISNVERAKIANNSGADLFIRIHANSLNNESVHGALTMCQTSKNPYNSQLYKKSSALSKAVVNGICGRTGFKNRGVQENDSMSGVNWCKLPVTIVEMGFMSNAEEDKKMATEECRDKIAKGIADGIDAYYAEGS